MQASSEEELAREGQEGERERERDRERGRETERGIKSNKHQ